MDENKGFGGRFRKAFYVVRGGLRFAGCWLAPAAFVLDRVTKLWAMRALRGGPSRDFLPGVLRFHYVENTGAAFGLLQGRQGLLAAVTGVVLLALLVGLIWQGPRLPKLPRAAAWLLLGGAVGNLYDRLFLGGVVDFLELVPFRFPVFNVADCCVTVAFALIAAWLLFAKEPKRDAG